jgi:hypothetical protein
VLPFKSISDAWLATGPARATTGPSTTIPPAIPAPPTQVVTAPPSGAISLRPAAALRSGLQFYSSANATAPAYALRSETRVTTGNAANAVKAQVLQSVVNRDAANDAIPFLTTVNVANSSAPTGPAPTSCPGSSPASRPPANQDAGLHGFQRVRLPKAHDRRDLAAGRQFPHLQRRLRAAGMGAIGSASSSPTTPSATTAAPRMRPSRRATPITSGSIPTSGAAHRSAQPELRPARSSTSTARPPGGTTSASARRCAPRASSNTTSRTPSRPGAAGSAGIP